MRYARAALLIAASILIGSLGAGCITPGEPRTLLRESFRLGESLFAHSDTEFMKTGMDPELGSRTIRANFTVTEEMALVGITFRGTFAWENSSAVLTLDRADGSTATVLRAERGLQDSTGTIGSFFEFHENVPAAPGLWEVRMQARGNVSTIDMNIHGVLSHDEVIERPIHVTEGRGVTANVLIDARGWGRTPDARIIEEDGTQTPLPLDGARDEQNHEVRLGTGEHRLVIETTRWGGVLIVIAETE